MALFRMAAAAGLLFAFAPEQTLRVVKTTFGLAEEARALQPVSAEAALNYCKANPSVCADVARQAAGLNATGSVASPAKASAATK
jgi:hypothetical protein